MTTNRDSQPLTYAGAGVDIDAGTALVERIAPAVRATRRPEVLTGLGGFGGLFAFDAARYADPVLVSGTDGVGTKLALAKRFERHDTVGIDLVAMCVNDIAVTGAEPLFFLDYFATGKLEVEHAAVVIEGIAEGCRAAGCALIGGETAEMPGMYASGDYDLAGFAVGVVERSALIDGSKAGVGDAVIGIGSSGPHANGFSLIRKVLERCDDPAAVMLGDQPLPDALLAPTRIYVRSLARLRDTCPVHALAHITGGGLVENLPRVLPEGVGARIDPASWPAPAVFDWLARTGNIDASDLWRTFNCGIGMVAVVPAASADLALSALAEAGEQAWQIGVLTTGDGVQFP